MSLKDRIKAVMFDFDGTLIDYDSKTTKETNDALRKLKEKGYTLILNSGRPVAISLLAVDDIFEDNYFDYCFGCNGSEFYDCQNHKLELLAYLDPATIKDVEKLLRSELLYVGVYDDTDFLVDKQPVDEYAFKWFKERYLNVKVVDFSKDIIKDYPKVLSLSAKEDRPQVTELIANINDERFDMYFSSPNALETVPKGVSKALSVEKILQSFDLKAEEILSFGDSANDIPMLVATTGVIMENADEKLKKDFTYRCPAIEDGGVYVFLKKEGFID